MNCPPSNGLIGRSNSVDVPLLLTAVSATSPCGEDMEYDAQFLQLERDAKGQPERSMGDAILPAEPPEWRSIQQQSLDLLARSKDLRITHFLLQSALALQGVAGLAEALTLIDALLRDYWADLHPRLDADDDNDPTVRINALTGLTCDTNIRLLRESILTRSRTFGPVSLRAALNASGLMSFPDEQLGAQQLNAAFLDSDPEQLQATRDALSAARRVTGPKVRERVRMLSRSRRILVSQVRPVRALMRTVGSLSSSASRRGCSSAQ